MSICVCEMFSMFNFLQLKYSLMLFLVILTSLPTEAMDIKARMVEMQRRRGTVANQ